jgi:hypothetical protein
MGAIRASLEREKMMPGLITYTVTMDSGYQWTLIVDLLEASAPLRADFHGMVKDPQTTPFQTADAQHCATHAARLVWDYFLNNDDEDDEINIVT